MNAVTRLMLPGIILMCSTTNASLASAATQGYSLDMAPPNAISEQEKEQLKVELLENASVDLSSSAIQPTSANGNNVPIFDKLVGWATSIASDRNQHGVFHTIIASGHQGRIFRWSGRAWDWDKLSGPSDTKKVFVGSGKIFRLLGNNILEQYRRDINGVFEWQSMGEVPDRFDARDPQIEVSPSGGVYYLSDDRQAIYQHHSFALGWLKIGGPASKIAAGERGLYAINPDKNQVWYYDDGSRISSTGPGWSLAFEFSSSSTSSHDDPEEITMSVSQDRYPNGIFAENGKTNVDYEHLWLKFPPGFPFNPVGSRYIKYNTGSKTIVRDVMVGNGESREKLTSQRGASTLVSFYASQNVYKLSVNETNGSVSWPAIATLGNASSLDPFIVDYVNTGKEAMLLDSDGFIYMNSGNTALASSLQEEPQSAPTVPPILLTVLGVSMVGVLRRRAF